MTTFIEDCLNCVDSKRGGEIPRPFGETTHGTKIGGCLHFDFLISEALVKLAKS